MSEIFFLQNHLVVNTPSYALPLLNDLKKKGHNVSVGINSNFNDKIDSKLSSTTVREVYENFNIKYFNDFESSKKVIKNSDPDLFITDLTMPNSQKLECKIHKYANNRTKVFEMDNRATEILYYGNKNWWYRSQYSPYYSLRLGGFLRHSLPVIANGLTLGRLGKPLNYFKPKLNSDVLTLKGNWWKNKMKQYLPIEDHERLVVTGSLRNDSIKNQMSKKLSNIELDKGKDTLVFCPLKLSNIWNKRSNLEMKKIINIIRDNFDFNIVIKLHPTDIRLSLSKKSIFGSEDYHICHSEDFYPLLRQSKISFSHFSSVGLESAITHTPHLFFDRYSKSAKMDRLYNQKGMKIGHGINKKNVCDSIDLVLDNKLNFDFDKFNEQFSNGLDGNSHLNMSDKIKDLI